MNFMMNFLVVCGSVLGDLLFYSKAEVPYFFTDLDRRASEIYFQISSRKLVALFPRKLSLGGFGNVIHHFMTQALSPNWNYKPIQDIGIWSLVEKLLIILCRLGLMRSCLFMAALEII